MGARSRSGQDQVSWAKLIVGFVAEHVAGPTLSSIGAKVGEVVGERIAQKIAPEEPPRPFICLDCKVAGVGEHECPEEDEDEDEEEDEEDDTEDTDPGDE